MRGAQYTIVPHGGDVLAVDRCRNRIGLGVGLIDIAKDGAELALDGRIGAGGGGGLIRGDRGRVGVGAGDEGKPRIAEVIGGTGSEHARNDGVARSAGEELARDCNGGSGRVLVGLRLARRVILDADFIRVGAERFRGERHDMLGTRSANGGGNGARDVGGNRGDKRGGLLCGGLPRGDGDGIEIARDDEVHGSGTGCGAGEGERGGSCGRSSGRGGDGAREYFLAEPAKRGEYLDCLAMDFGAETIAVAEVVGGKALPDFSDGHAGFRGGILADNQDLFRDIRAVY